MSEPVATGEVVVSNPQGLHLRPAEKFAKLAQTFEADIEVGHQDYRVDAKSIMNIMTLGAAQGVKLTLTASGPDAEAAVQALINLVERQFAADETMSQGSSG